MVMREVFAREIRRWMMPCYVCLAASLLCFLLAEAFAPFLLVCAGITALLVGGPNSGLGLNSLYGTGNAGPPWAPGSNRRPFVTGTSCTAGASGPNIYNPDAFTVAVHTSAATLPQGLTHTMTTLQIAEHTFRQQTHRFRIVGPFQLFLAGRQVFEHVLEP